MEREDEPTVTMDTRADAPRALGATPKRFGPPTHVDRFVVIDILGEGGMGTVFAAYDTRLDRKVALKVVRARRHDPELARERLVREAQAMAKIAHPNVVTVLESGTIDDDIYVALEYVEGTTLRQWLKEKPSWQAIIATFVQAGRGLAAAHDAGLVHRDFKPENVLIRRDGRVQVTDFGLVSVVGSREPSGTDERAASPVPAPAVAEVGSSDNSGDITAQVPRRAERSAGSLTREGTRVGTPRYMAPEQHDGGPVDARTDQFAFCVALWEALYAVRPFTGRTYLELAAAASSGEFRAPAGSEAPRWLEGVLRRGLSPEPADRWPSMQALLAVLERDRGRRRRQLAVAAGVGGVVVATSAIAYLGWTREPELSPCTGFERQLAGSWDAERAAALQTAFAATRAPFAAAASSRVIDAFDRWTRNWVAAREDACRATLRGEQSDLLLDRRMDCLDRQLGEVRALATVLTSADGKVVAESTQAVSHLPTLGACADRDALSVIAPPGDLATRARVEGLRGQLAAARAHEHAGRYHVGRVLATEAARGALAIDYPPLRAEALVARAELEDQDGDPKAAETTLASALHEAGVARDDRTAARAAIALVESLSSQARAAEADAVAIAADATVARTGDPILEGNLALQRGRTALVRGDYPASERQLQRALAVRTAALGADHVDVAETLNLLGGLAERRGDGAQAKQYYQRALAIAEARLGLDHPSTAVTRANVCHLDFLAGEIEPARACQEKVVATIASALGGAHPTLAWALNDVALIQETQGDRDGARLRFERALAIWERASGPEHPDVAWPLINLGQLALRRHDLAQADALCRRAVRIFEKSSGRDHPDLAFALGCLGEVLVETAPADAVTTLTRARELFGTGVPEAGDIGAVRFHLARALDRTGEHARAVAEARAARDLVAKDASSAELREEIRQWLARHGS